MKDDSIKMTEKNAFLREVLNAFAFLIEKHGFRCVKKSDNLIRYESKSVFVSLDQDPKNGEVTASIGLISDDAGKEVAYEIGEIASFVSENKGLSFTLSDSDECSDRLQLKINQQARLTMNYANEALAGDNFFFKSIAEYRTRMARHFAKADKLKLVRQEAEKAWREKKYPTIARLYSSIEKDLTESELKKLAYARNQLTKR